MIQVLGLQKSFGGRVLFEDISFNLSQGEHVGLVGRNGSGKSTLIKMLLGQELPDAGQIIFPKNYRVGYLEQHLHFTHKTIVGEVMSIFPEEEQYLTYRAEEMLMGLGFTLSDMERAPSEFSGGFQIRLNLAKLLLAEPELLLLDEPTNYLDILSMRYVMNFLKKWRRELILISHDRSFMDDVVDYTMGIVRKKLKKVKGGTADFYQQVLLEEETWEKTRLNEGKKKAQLQRFVDRFGSKATKAKQAQSKMKQIEKMGTKEALVDEADLDFSFSYSPCEAKTLLSCKNLSFAFPAGPRLIHDLSFELKKGDCIGIIGKNGRGKSTLLNLITGILPLEENTKTENIFQFHPIAKMGLFGQTNINRLNNKSTIEDEITAGNPELSRTRIRGICGIMMFSGDDALKKISVLSGGERARVMLGKILATPCNVLLLDEPTNHLDMESIEGLCEGVESFSGGVMIATHSELILRNVCNKIIAFLPDRTVFYPGGYDEFLQDYESRFFEENTSGDAISGSLGKNIQETVVSSPKEKREKEKRSPNNEKKRQKLEDQIADLEQVLMEKEEAYYQLSMKNEHQKFRKAQQEIDEVKGQIDLLMAEWEKLSN